MKLISLNVGPDEAFTHPEDLSTVLARHFLEVSPDPAEWAWALDPDLDPRICFADMVQEAKNRGLDRVSSAGPWDAAAAISVGGDRGFCLVVRENRGGPGPQCTADLIIQDDATAIALGADLVHLDIQRYRHSVPELGRRRGHLMLLGPV